MERHHSHSTGQNRVICYRHPSFAGCDGFVGVERKTSYISGILATFLPRFPRTPSPRGWKSVRRIFDYPEALLLGEVEEPIYWHHHPANVHSDDSHDPVISN